MFVLVFNIFYTTKYQEVTFFSYLFLCPLQAVYSDSLQL